MDLHQSLADLHQSPADRIDEALQRARALLVDLEHAREANAAHVAELHALAAEFHAEEA